MSKKNDNDRFMMTHEGVKLTKGNGKVLVNLKDWWAGGSGVPGQEGSVTKEEKSKGNKS